MSNRPNSPVIYSERVLPRWTSFLPLLLIFPSFWLTFAPINLAIGSALGILVTAVVTVIMLRASPEIVVTSSTLRVAKAEIHLANTGKLEIVAAGQTFAERGPKLDARAHLAIQGSVKGLIKLEISDKNDPTPYWLFSSRSPESIKIAVESAKS